MNKKACNPYLPLNEYIPDGEPRVFGDRLYVYGSHDSSECLGYCTEDYVVWSAPLNDLGDWRFEGVSYRKEQDPHNLDSKKHLYAPDVVCGVDGRYYLYYCRCLEREFGVAVSDAPEGPFRFYGYISNRDGSIFGEFMPYDPSVLVDDDGRIFLYYGFGMKDLRKRFNVASEHSPGCMCIELDQDMKTVISEPVCLIPTRIYSAGTSFEGHEYFEAPSMRKIRGKYYLVYSSSSYHELCYAVSNVPNGGFVFGGVIVDNGDLGYQGNALPVMIMGNNHGGIVEIGENAYIFYHRHTHGCHYARQGCAEKIHILSDGSIPQVEVTSQGINGKPLLAEGKWPAAIACRLSSPVIEKTSSYDEPNRDEIPYIWEGRADEGDDCGEVYIRNLTSGSVVGYKYFEFTDISAVELELKGTAVGEIRLVLDKEDQEHIATLPIECTKDWMNVQFPVRLNGIHAIYFHFEGSGSFDMKTLCFV